MAAHQYHQRDGCLRVKADFNTEIRQFVAPGDTQQIVTLTASDKARQKCRDKGLPVEPQTVRLIRITVKKKVYILMTNLLDTQHYCVPAFKALYHVRWQIEEGYKRQKSWLEIENVTGKSVLSVQPDYHAQPQYRYQINFAHALSTMKDTLVKCLYDLLSMLGFTQLVETIRQSLTIIRPGRRFERKKRSIGYMKFNPCYKRML